MYLITPDSVSAHVPTLVETKRYFGVFLKLLTMKKTISYLPRRCRNLPSGHYGPDKDLVTGFSKCLKASELLPR